MSDDALIEAIAKQVDPDACHPSLKEDQLGAWWHARRRDAEQRARAVAVAIESSGHRVVEAAGMAMIDAQNRALLDRAFCMASDVAALVEAQRHEIDAMLAAAPKVTE